MLLLLYYLSQNPDFSESIKPLMGQLKNSEQMLKFLKDLNGFSEIFSVLGQNKSPQSSTQTPPPPKPQSPQNTPHPDSSCGENSKWETPVKNNSDCSSSQPCPSHTPFTGEENAQKKENPQSPLSGIADKYIQDCLEQYFKKR